MRIAYIGPAKGTSLHRARALERLGHNVTVIDPWSWLGDSKWMGRWLYHTGGIGVGLFIDRRIFDEVKKIDPEVIWVNQGEFLGHGLMRKLRSLQVPIVNYTNDDPFNGRDSKRFKRYLKALPYYDLLALVRDVNLEEASSLGTQNAMRIWMSADEELHKPLQLTKQDREKWSSEVAFIGTWMPERGPFMKRLVEKGIPLSIWGDRWYKAKEWPILRRYWRGPGLYNVKDYVKAIQCAKICLGLLSKGNRDLHTRRSMEIPAIGTLFCAERTSEHMHLYEEDKEAVFWKDADECAEKCKWLLANDETRKRIARAGHERCLKNGYFNENVCSEILDRLMRIK